MHTNVAIKPVRRRSYFQAASWIWFAGCLFVLLFFLARHMGALLNSDMAGDLILPHMLVQNGEWLSRNWYYSTDLRVFNTQLVFGALFLLTDNWVVVRLAGTLLLLLLLLACIWYFCASLHWQRWFPILGGILVLPTSTDYFEITLLYTGYIPYLCTAFVVFGTAFRCSPAWKRRKKIAVFILMSLLALLSGLGGPRLVLCLYVPLFLGAVVFYLQGTAPDRPFLSKENPAWPWVYYAGYNLIFAVAGYGINAKFLSGLYSYKSYENALYYISFYAYRLEAFINSWLAIFGYTAPEGNAALFDLSVTLPNFMAFALLFLVGYAVCDILRFPDRYSSAIRFCCLFLVAGFCTFFFLYLFTSMPCNARYNIPLVVFCPPLVVAFFLQRAAQRRWRIVAVCVLCGLGLSAAFFYHQLRTVDENVGHRKAVDFLVSQGYTEGFATFWNADVCTELSNGALELWAWPEDNTELTDPLAVHPGLQLISHRTTPPEGRLFVLFSSEEMQSFTLPQRLDSSRVLYADSDFTIYGYDSYDAFVSDINQ